MVYFSQSLYLDLVQNANQKQTGVAATIQAAGHLHIIRHVNITDHLHLHVNESLIFIY